MSRERQRAREARQQQQREQAAAAARERTRQARRRHLRERLSPTLPRRRRRYGALTTLELVRLVMVFFAVQGAAWLFVPALGSRFAVAILTLACLAVGVRTRRRPSR